MNNCKGCIYSERTKIKGFVICNLFGKLKNENDSCKEQDNIKKVTDHSDGKDYTCETWYRIKDEIIEIIKQKYLCPECGKEVDVKEVLKKMKG